MAILIPVGGRLLTPDQVRSTYRWKQLAKAACPPGSVCSECRRPILFGLRHGHPAGPSADHIIPLELGGAPFDPANVRPLCHGCNSRKGKKLRLGQAETHCADW